MTEVKLDKVRKLKFTNRALYEIEEKLGSPVLVLMQDSQKLQSIKVMTTLVWGGLLHKDDMTFDEVMDIIPTNMNHFAKVVESVMVAISDAMGIDGSDKQKKGKKLMAQAGTGT